MRFNPPIPCPRSPHNPAFCFCDGSVNSRGHGGQANCNATTALLQAAIDAAWARGGGWARVPCGFHATLPLRLLSGVRLGSAGCVGAEALEAENKSSTLCVNFQTYNSLRA